MTGAHRKRWTLGRRITDREAVPVIPGRHHITRPAFLHTKHAIENCIIRVFRRTGEPRVAKLIMNSRYGKTWPGANIGSGL